MPEITTDKFLGLLKRSGLIDDQRLAAFLEQQAASSDAAARVEDTPPEVLSRQLIEAGLITEWQADMLHKGKHRGFFLGKYKLLGHIGRGGMSSVYLAEHTLMQRRVAIKVLPQNRVDDASYLARFQQEARAAAQLEDPNIVRAYDVDQDGKTHYLVMEYVDGRDLHQVVSQDGPLKYNTAADYIRQAARGLQHAHDVGLVHRDIKPANLLLDPKQVVKILDMGLAKFSETEEPSLTLAHDEQILGTADYLAPEQALNSHTADHRADIYSLGCTLYFLLTGHPPFDKGSIRERLLKHQVETPPSIYKDRPDAPPSLVSICNRMMSKKPEARFQTSSEVAAALADWLRERGHDVEDGSSGSRGSSDSGGGIGRLNRPFMPAPETVSAGSSNVETMGGDADEDLGFAPLEEESQPKVEEASASDSSVSAGDKSTERKSSESSIVLGGEAETTQSSSASGSGGKSLVEEVFEQDSALRPLAKDSTVTGPGASAKMRMPQQQEASRNTSLIVLLIIAGVAVLTLALVALLGPGRGRRSEAPGLQSRPAASQVFAIASADDLPSDAKHQAVDA